MKQDNLKSKLFIHKLLFIMVFLYFGYRANVCTNDLQIKRQIQSVEKKYISKGSYGEVYGNDQYVSKTMETRGSLELELLNNELKVMLAFKKEHDIMGLQKNSCYYEKLNYLNDYKVKIKMYRMVGDLKEYIKENPMKNNIFWKLDIMFQIAISLKKLHDRNIKHLDLKEMNILMMNKYTPVLSDFGFSLINNQTRNFESGTPLFMSPEISRGIYKKAADIYALGIVYFQLLNSIFLRSKQFRISCNYLEWTYEKIYCRFATMIDKMLNYNYEFRPDIDQILIQIVQEIAYQRYYNQSGYNEYFNQQKQYFNNRNLSQTTLLFLDVLKQKLAQRQVIYEDAYNNKQIKELQASINNYSVCSNSPTSVLNTFNQKFDIIGNQVKNDDYEQSLQSVRQRIQQSEQERKVGLNEENFIKIQDQNKQNFTVNKQVQNIQAQKEPIMKESKRDAPLLNGQKKFAKIVLFVKKQNEKNDQTQKQVISNEQPNLNIIKNDKKPEENITTNQNQQSNLNQIQAEQKPEEMNIEIQNQNINQNQNIDPNPQIQNMQVESQNQVNEQYLQQQYNYQNIQQLQILESHFKLYNSKLIIPMGNVIDEFLQDLQQKIDMNQIFALSQNSLGIYI